jgi:hypothetical protein
LKTPFPKKKNLRNGEILKRVAMFSTFMARFSFKPIKNCPGRFVLRGRKVVDLKELGEDLVWAELDKCSRDAVWVSKFVDETGGLIVFEKRNNKDRTLVVTLSNTSGFERKMHMLYASLNAFRWVGGAPCPQSFVVLVVLKRSDLFAHRGTGLIRREAVHATQQFLLDENWTLEEAEGGDFASDERWRKVWISQNGHNTKFKQLLCFAEFSNGRDYVEKSCQDAA